MLTEEVSEDYDARTHKQEEVNEIAKSNVIVSDISGDVLDTNHIKVTLKEVAGDATYVLDVARDEIQLLLANATKQGRRGRKPKVAPVAEPVSEPEAEPVAA